MPCPKKRKPLSRFLDPYVIWTKMTICLQAKVWCEAVLKVFIQYIACMVDSAESGVVFIREEKEH